MMRLTLKQILLILFCLHTLFVIPGIFLREFSTRGEAREALVIQDIFNNHEIILPHGYGGVVPSKPPLLHWLAAACSLPFGQVTEGSSRLPSALASICCILIFVTSIFRQFGSKISFLTGVIIMSGLEWLRTAGECRVDMVLTACLIMAFLSVLSWHEKENKGFPWILTLASALAVLCKGPVGVVLPAAVFALWNLFEGRSIKSILVRGCLAFLPALSIAAVWYGLAYLERPEEFISKVYYENVARFLSSQDDEPHKHSAAYLIGTLLLGTLPWILLIFPKAISGRFKFLQNARAKYSSLKKFDRFGLLVVVVTILFYSIPSSKRSVYLLPVHPFIATWLSRILLYGIESGQAYIRRFLIGLRSLSDILIVVCLLLGTSLVSQILSGIGNGTQFDLIRSFQMAIRSYSWPTFLFAIPLVALLIWTRVAKLKSVCTAISSFCVLLVVSQIMVIPAVLNTLSSKAYGRELGIELEKNPEPILSFGQEFYGLSFYSGKEFMRLEDHKSISDVIVVTGEEDRSRLEQYLGDGFKITELSKSKNWVTTPNKLVVSYKVSKIS